MAPAKSPRHEALGSAIRAVRESRGLSQEDAAYACGLERRYYGGIERGEMNVAVAKVWKVADGLAVRASELFARGEAPETEQEP